jgi:aminoglycoside phosphotransferase family enzyme/predicted kinase
VLIFSRHFVRGTAFAKYRVKRRTVENLETQNEGLSHLQDRLVAAMMNPGFYPKPPPEIIHKETHISHVFLAGDLVYKIKKAVRFPFLDYSTLDRRVRFLNDELQLNRRLAPSVYLAVMPITLDGSEWHLGGDGPPAEYVLIMRRLPERRMLPFLLETGQVTPAMMVELAEVLARFHAQAQPVRLPDVSGYPKALAQKWNNNLHELAPWVKTPIDAEAVELLKTFGARFIDQHCDLLIQRAQEGWIRDVHGDLHCDHVCFAPEGIQIFDCIEFDAEIRQCDLASEMAFLAMDLAVRGGEFAIKVLFTRYLELLNDPAMPVLMPFYQSYRAVVRAKVHALRTGGINQEAKRYLHFAVRFTWDPVKPFLVLISGLTGSGKSTLARELGARLGMPVINSDAIRKATAGKTGRQAVPLNRGIYVSKMTEKTYTKMAQEAEKQIPEGEGAILDATFGRKAHREKIVQLAEKHKVPLVLIYCVASDEVTEKRLAQREAEGKDVSDGRWEIYSKQKAAFEPIIELPLVNCLKLNTEAPLDELVRASEKFLRARFGQR